MKYYLKPHLYLLQKLMFVFGCILIPSCRQTIKDFPTNHFSDSPTIDTVVFRELTTDSLIIYHILSMDNTVALCTDSIEMEPNNNRIFFCSAAFTSPNGEIVGHAYSDRYIKNPKDRNVTGGVICDRYRGFTQNSKWTFLMGGYEAELEQRVKDGSIVSAFAQNMIIYLGVIQDMSWRYHSGTFDIHKYRALCELSDGEIVIVESLTPVAYDCFVTRLDKLRIYNALYLDMGTYNRIWYTPYLIDGFAIDDSLYRFDGVNSKKCSNGLVFYYLN